MKSVIYDVKITGTRPLLMHNGQLADPMNVWAKRIAEITSTNKRNNRSDANYEEIARREFHGGLYYDEEAGPVVEAIALEAMMKVGARMAKKGKQFEAGVECEEAFSPLIYDGPRGRDELWDFRLPDGSRPYCDRRGVKIGTARVIRTRPRFPRWSVEFGVRVWEVAPINGSDVEKAIENAGHLIGLFDFRPRFGLFEITSFSERGKAKKAA